MGIVFIAVVSAVIIIIFVASLYSALSIGPFNFSSSNHFGSNEPPPQIIMINDNNKEHKGVLDSYSFVNTEKLNQIPVFNYKVTATIPDKSITLEKGSIVRVVIEGNPSPESPPDGLAVAAYTEKGNPVKVLKVNEDKSKKETSFIIDLNEGDYILMAVATWLPDEDDERITGYVAYSYRVNVVAGSSQA